MGAKMCINREIVEMTLEEIDGLQAQAEKTKIEENSRPLTAEEVTRLIICQQVNSLSIDDATASRMVDYFPELTGDGSLVKAGTRINWNGTLKQAAVDLWDTAANTPDAAPTLWVDLAYKDGYRIIPAVITVTTAFADGEYGWWGGCSVQIQGGYQRLHPGAICGQLGAGCIVTME